MGSGLYDRGAEEREKLLSELEALAKSCTGGWVVASPQTIRKANRLLEIGNLFDCGIAQFVLGDLGKAEHCFIDASQSDGYWVFEALLWAANAAYADLRIEDALVLYQNALEQDPESAVVKRMLATCHMISDAEPRLDNFNKAILLLEENALAAVPETTEYADAYDNLGKAYRMDGVPVDKRPGDCLERSEAAHMKALGCFSEFANSEEWARVAVNLVPVMALLN